MKHFLTTLGVSLFFIFHSSFFISCTQSIPLVFDEENTAAEYMLPLLIDDPESLPAVATLPDPLAFADGSGRATSYAQWEQRRAEIMAQLQFYEIGTKPATPSSAVKATMPNDSLLVVTITVADSVITLHCPVTLPTEGTAPYPAVIGIGWGAGSLPTDIFTSRGIATVGFPFWEVMAHTQVRGEQPINALYPDLVDMGAYAAWPWGVSRLIDGLAQIEQFDLHHLAISGCSFAGKMALFAGAFDERIALTIAQEPGGGGAAAWRVSETLGNVETLGRTNYAWFMESMRRFADENVARLPIDHHELCALVAPRALLVIGNPDWEWLADESCYVSCVAAHQVWQQYGIADRMGWTFQGGHMHCMLPPEQRPDVEAFVDRFLLGLDVPTDIRKAPMFAAVDTTKWMPWTANTMKNEK